MPDDTFDDGGVVDAGVDFGGLLPDAIADELVDLPAAIEMHKMTRLEEQAATARAVIFEKVGYLNNEEGVDIDRVDRFMEALNFTNRAEYLIVDDVHRREVILALDAAGIDGDTLMDDWEDKPSGTYWNPLGLVVVYRDGSADMAESVCQHEEAHATAGVNDQASDDTFMEEGFARWVQNMYESAVLLSAEGKPERGVHVPDKYRLRHSYNSGAKMWDVLFNARPELLDVVIDSRANPGSAADVSQIINSLSPFLYERIQHVPTHHYLDGRPHTRRTARAYDRGLKMVLKAAGATKADLPEICDRGEAAQQVARKLAAYEAAHSHPFRRNGV